MRTITRIARGTALAALFAASNFIANAEPIIYTADTPSFTLLATGTQNNQSQINTAIAGYIAGTTLQYKSEQSPAAEEGSLLGSYNTAYQNPTLVDNDFQITWTGGQFVNGDKKFLLVKDGTGTPAWYLFDISAWDGTEALFGVGLFPGKVPDGISNVQVYSNRVGTSVPDGGATLLMLGMAVTGLGFFHRKMS